MIVSNNDAYNVKGGVALKTAAIVTGIFVFLLGVIDGLVHPKACNK